jgi:hypothetical protein
MADPDGSSSLKKAIIHVLDARGNKKREVPVLFYPSEYTIEKSNEFASINIPGLESPILQFTRGGLGTLSMELYFDSYEEDNDVRIYTDKVANLLNVDPELHAPPVLRFIWGNLNFTCVLTKVTKKFTMFRQDGIPVRATLSVSFSQFLTDADIMASPLHSPDKTKIYTIKQGDNLWGIAAREYGDPAFWRPIANKNGIENPRILEAGRVITIPPLEN